MKYLYTLTFYHWIQDYRQGFFIGVFSSYEKAEHIAKKFKKEVQGFKDFPCEYEIISKKVIGQYDNAQSVYMLWGWNLNENLDEVDIWESDLYFCYNEAKIKLERVKNQLNLQEWSLDQYMINQSYCCDGFVEVLHD